MGTSPDWEEQRKEESVESLKLGKVVPTGHAQRIGSGGKYSGRGVWWCEGLSCRRDRGQLGPCPSSPGNCSGKSKIPSELGECRAVRAGERGFLSRLLRGRVLQYYVIREEAVRPGVCVGVEGADGFFAGVAGDYAILHVGFHTTDEKGLKSVLLCFWAGWGGDKVVRWMSRLKGSGKELCGEQGEGVV